MRSCRDTAEKAAWNSNIQSSPRLLYLAAILSFLKALSANETRLGPPARMLLEEPHRAIRIFWAGRFDTNQISNFSPLCFSTEVEP
jgi:hypothetical protein